MEPGSGQVGALLLSSGLWAQDTGSLLPCVMAGEASTWRSGKEEGRRVGERDQRVLEKAVGPEDSAGAK